MPQLDKVTFLSQFFWFCVVFGGLYLCLVKYYLPVFARIVKLRQNFSDTELVHDENSKVNNASSHIFKESIDESLESLKSCSQNLQTSSVKVSEKMIDKISQGNLAALSSKARSDRTLAEFSLIRVVPPMGRSFQLSFDNDLQVDSYNNVVREWFDTSQIFHAVESTKKKSKAKKAKKASK